MNKDPSEVKENSLPGMVNDKALNKDILNSLAFVKISKSKSSQKTESPEDSKIESIENPIKPACNTKKIQKIKDLIRSSKIKAVKNYLENEFSLYVENHLSSIKCVSITPNHKFLVSACGNSIHL